MKKLTNKEMIEVNRRAIDALMRQSAKNVASINMLRHEITSVEPMILAKPQTQGFAKDKQMAFVDWTNLKNIGVAYDYILKHKKTNIDMYQMTEIQKILTRNTDVRPGYRISGAMVLGKFAPSIEQIYYKMEQIEYHLHDENYPVLTRAFDTHFDIIMTQPYNDYNKRTARLIMNWFLMQNGYRPIIFNKKTDATAYTDALHNRIDGNRRAYTDYMESSMLHTQKQIIKLLKMR
ncbi:MAG: Fic family protein [Alphaproteobacteria bacterium]|nr:Fic family protein [Alphaproteobacteria bacterium]